MLISTCLESAPLPPSSPQTTCSSQDRNTPTPRTRTRTRTRTRVARLTKPRRILSRSPPINSPTLQRQPANHIVYLPNQKDIDPNAQSLSHPHRLHPLLSSRQEAKAMPSARQSIGGERCCERLRSSLRRRRYSSRSMGRLLLRERGWECR